MNKFLATLVITLGTELVEKVFKPLFLSIPIQIKKYLENRKKKKEIDKFKETQTAQEHNDQFGKLP